MSRNSQLIKNTLIIALGKLSTQFLTFLLLPLYTAYLSTSEFGAVDLTLTYISLLAPLMMLTTEMSAFRFLVDARKNNTEKTNIITNALHIALSGALAVIVLYLAISIFITIPYGWIVPGAIIAMIFSNLFLQIARGLGNNLQFTIGGIVTGVTTIAANIVFIIVLGMGAEGMLLAVAIANAVGVLYILLALRLHRHISVDSVDTKTKKELLKYSLPLVPNSISWWLINAADRTIITVALGVASNGVYAVAYRFPLIFNGLFSFFGMSWTESASMHINSPDRDKFFSQTMNASLKAFGALGALIIAAVPFIFGLFVNESFAEAYWYIPVLIIGAFFNSIVGLYSAIYIAKKMTKQVLYTSVGAALLSIGFTLAFINTLGIWAAAFAMVIAFGSMAIFRHYHVRRFVNVTYNVGVFWTLGGLYTVAIGLYYVDAWWASWLNLAVVCAVVAWMEWGVLKKLINEVGSKIKKLQ